MPDNLPEHVEMKWDFSELTDSATTGDATKATAEKGEIMAKAIVDCVVKAITQLDEKNWDYRTRGIK